MTKRRRKRSRRSRSGWFAWWVEPSAAVRRRWLRRIRGTKWAALNV
jgi:hypothetical protein